MAQQTAFPALHRQNFMSLTTYRKTGVAVPTPVWFVQEGSKLYLLTQPQAGKLKRIRHTARVTVAPCTASGKILGDSAEGQARILSAEEGKHANALLNRKYGWQKRMIELFWRLRRGGAIIPVYIEITPA